MARLIWTHQAIADLGTIGDHIAVDSEKYAKVTVRRLFYRTEILKQLPRSGRIVPEKNEENVRELIEGNYRIIYEIFPGDIIYILSIYHSARELRL